MAQDETLDPPPQRTAPVTIQCESAGDGMTGYPSAPPLRSTRGPEEAPFRTGSRWMLRGSEGPAPLRGPLHQHIRVQSPLRLPLPGGLQPVVGLEWGRPAPYKLCAPSEHERRVVVVCSQQITQPRRKVVDTHSWISGDESPGPVQPPGAGLDRGVAVGHPERGGNQTAVLTGGQAGVAEEDAIHSLHVRATGRSERRGGGVSRHSVARTFVLYRDGCRALRRRVESLILRHPTSGDREIREQVATETGRPCSHQTVRIVRDRLIAAWRYVVTHRRNPLARLVARVGALLGMSEDRSDLVRLWLVNYGRCTSCPIGKAKEEDTDLPYEVPVPPDAVGPATRTVNVWEFPESSARY